MDADTAAAWAGWAAAAISTISLAIAVRANRHSRDSVKEAARSATAAEASLTEARRSADAAETSSVEARRSADAAERQAAAAEAMIPPPPPKVAWQVSRATAAIWMLTNIGTDAVRNVDVTVPGWDPDLVEQDGGVLVRPGGRMSVRAQEVEEMPPLLEFHVTWDGQAEPMSVLIPGS